jgi:hypothetical protein
MVQWIGGYKPARLFVIVDGYVAFLIRGSYSHGFRWEANLIPSVNQ